MAAENDKKTEETNSLPTRELKEDTPAVFHNSDDSATDKDLCKKNIMNMAFKNTFSDISPNTN